MPRSGVNGTYTLPPNTDNQAPLTTISSAMFNAFADDVEQTNNTPVPIAYGGTNAATEAAARTNLGVPAISDLYAYSQRRDRIVNGNMAASQENANTAGTANGYAAADQFFTYRNTSAGVITSQRVQSVTPAGSLNRYRVTITTADASLAAGEYLQVSTPLEGSNVADFQYGLASAKQAVLRFGFKGPTGTYGVSLQNYNGGVPNRSYVAMFTIAGGQANTDTIQTIVVPGSTAGTWLTADGVIGVTLNITLAAGTTYQGTAGWSNSNVYATSAISNGMGTAAAVFEIFDVGLKMDADATGVYGNYEAVVDAVYRGERYYGIDSGIGVYGSGLVYTSTLGIIYYSWSIAMCKKPALAISTAVHFKVIAGGSSYVGSVHNFVNVRTTSAEFDWTISGAPSGSGAVLEGDSVNAYISRIARLN